MAYSASREKTHHEHTTSKTGDHTYRPGLHGEGWLWQLPYSGAAAAADSSDRAAGDR